MTGTKITSFFGGGSDNSNDFGGNFSIFVLAIKPIRNLQVTYRGQTYTIREGVSTVNELTAHFERMNNTLGNMGHRMSPKGIVWKGQILKPGDDLSKAGIKHGDRVMILPGDKEVKAVDILGVYLFLLSSNEKAITDTISHFKQEQPEAVESMKEVFQGMKDDVGKMTPKHVSNALRNGMDLSYHRLRSWWEHPSLRQGLHDPEKIENYRKVVSTNLSTKFLKKLSSSASPLQKIIESPDLWRREFSKLATKVIRFGDTILEGILDVLLDLLKGSRSSSLSEQHVASVEEGRMPATSNTSADFDVTNEMEDPSLANNLLFELSESEDEFDLDEL